MTDHPNAKDRVHARPETVEILSDTVAAEHWTASAPVQEDQFGEAGRVPMRVARLAWEAYAAAGHGGQDLETMNRRGGFSWGELIMLLRGPAHYHGDHWNVCYKDCGKGRTL